MSTHILKKLVQLPCDCCFAGVHAAGTGKLAPKGRAEDLRLSRSPSIRLQTHTEFHSNQYRQELSGCVLWTPCLPSPVRACILPAVPASLPSPLARRILSCCHAILHSMTYQAVHVLLKYLCRSIYHYVDVCYYPCIHTVVSRVAGFLSSHAAGLATIRSHTMYACCKWFLLPSTHDPSTLAGTGPPPTTQLTDSASHEPVRRRSFGSGNPLTTHPRNTRSDACPVHPPRAHILTRDFPASPLSHPGV